MKNIVFYFQMHQPKRIREYRRSEIGHNHEYFWNEKNREILERAISKCYIPTTKLLIENGISASISISGVLLEQLLELNSDVIDILKEYFRSGLGELMDETYYHSLSSVWDLDEFKNQVLEHNEYVSRIFGIRPVTFRNTELIYNDEISKAVKELGYDTIITEGTDEIISKYSPNHKYSSVSGMNLLLRNYRLSDDISFRFSNRSWNEYPLFADKYARWLQSTPGELINLFMDYETFGEHNWKETGIFEFIKALPKEIQLRNMQLSTIKNAVKENESRGVISVPNTISWADTERDLSAWLGNEFQQDAFEIMKSARNNKNVKLWRMLQTSDHFYYMSTKHFSDQEVHEYFNPYHSPYLAFIYYTNIFEDFLKTFC